MSVTLYGFFQSYEPEYKRIKILFIDNKFTEDYILNLSKSNGHSPTFPGGFYIKYNTSSKFIKNSEQNTIEILKNLNVKCIIQKKIYNHKDRSGWYLLLKEMSNYTL
jgi:hypothetical protein